MKVPKSPISRLMVWSATLTTLGAIALPAGAVADDCSNAQYRQGPAAFLPDCRAYEQVSQVNKFGAHGAPWAPHLAYGAWSAPSGDRFAFMPVQGPGIAEPNRGWPLPVVASRRDAGWDTRIAMDGPNTDATLNGVQTIPRYMIWNSGLTRFAFSTGTPYAPEQPLETNDTNGAVNAVDEDGSVRWISAPTWGDPGAKLTYQAFAPVGASEDLSTVYFISRARLTPADAFRGTDDSWALYRSRNGVLANAGILPNGTVDPGGSTVTGFDFDAANSGVLKTGSEVMTSPWWGTNPVSRDGTRVSFVSPSHREKYGRPPQLYLRVDGEATRMISKRAVDADAIVGSKGIVPVGALQALGSFGGVSSRTSGYASEDGRYHLFATVDALLPGADATGATVHTYRYDADAPVAQRLQHLPDLDRPSVAAQQNQRGNVYRMSPDGRSILFVSASGKLMLWREGRPTAELADAVPEPSLAFTGISDAQFSPDGSVVVLHSYTPLAGEPRHPAGGGNARTQIYRYTDQDGLECVSCPDTGAADAGASTYAVTSSLAHGMGTNVSPSSASSALTETRAMSSDGKQVFFTTLGKLDPADTNGTYDVYVWKQDDGRAHLLSSGTDSRPSYLLDVSASGDDVFIATAAPLVKADQDDLFDVYDVRVNGGLPDPPPFIPPGCALTNCEPPIGAPSELRQGSSSQLGSSSTGATSDAPPGVSKLAVTRVRTAKHRVTLGVRAPASGTIRVSGSGLVSQRRTVSRRGVVTLKSRLTQNSVRTLSRKGRRTVRITVRFTDAQSKRTTRVTESVRFTVARNRKGA